MNDDIIAGCQRPDPNGLLVCSQDDCLVEEKDVSTLQAHLELVHGGGRKLVCQVASWDMMDHPAMAIFKAKAQLGTPSVQKDVPLASPVLPALATASTVSSSPEVTPPQSAQDLQDPTASHSLRRPRSVQSLTSRVHPYRSSPPSTRASSRSNSPSSSGRNSPLVPSGTTVQPSPLTQVAYSAPPSPPAGVDDGMQIDEEDDDTFLNRFSLALLHHQWVKDVSPVPRMLTCKTCLQGVTPADAASHVKSHGLPMSTKDKKSLKTWIDAQVLLCKTSETVAPRPRQAPVHGLAISVGFACKRCTLCFPVLSTFQTHWSDHHRTLGPAKKNVREDVKLQSFFRKHPFYFEVLPSLTGVETGDAFALYLEQIAPQIEASTVVNPPVSVKEVPPLLQVMLWHEHLEDHLKDKRSIQALRTLMELPTGDRAKTSPLGNKLQKTVLAYMHDIKAKAKKSNLAVRMLLIQCPLYVYAFRMTSVVCSLMSSF